MPARRQRHRHGADAAPGWASGGLAALPTLCPPSSHAHPSSCAPPQQLLKTGRSGRDATVRLLGPLRRGRALAWPADVAVQAAVP